MFQRGYVGITKPPQVLCVFSRSENPQTGRIRQLVCISSPQTRSQVLLTDNCRILLYPSFTPFVIVFTHAITTASPDDLVLLHETVNSLELIKGLSRGSTRLYEICTAFVKTAQALADSRQTLTGLEQHHDGLLLMPGLDGHGQASITLPDVAWPEDMYGSMNSADISGFLNDFIGTNRSAMDILNSIP